MLSLFSPTAHLLVGIEPDTEPDRTRVFIDARYLGVYVLVDTATGEDLQRGWYRHTYIDVPDDAPRYKETPDERAAAIAKEGD